MDVTALTEKPSHTTSTDSFVSFNNKNIAFLFSAVQQESVSRVTRRKLAESLTKSLKKGGGKGRALDARHVQRVNAGLQMGYEE